jgi:YD repeat-containing protein
LIYGGGKRSFAESIHPSPATMQRIAFLLALLLVTLRTIAQVSVDHATGRGSVSIPIAQVGEGHLNVPIQLAYDASGIQVGTASSNVGLQWSLSTGPRIIRIVRDAPDEATTILQTSGGNIILNTGNYMYDDGHLQGDPEIGRSGFRDCEPDLFVVELTGKTVAFYLKPGTPTPTVVYANNQNDVVVEPIMTTEPINVEEDEVLNIAPDLEQRLATSARYNRLVSFKVIDTDGTLYYFGERTVDREYTFSAEAYLDSHELAWVLNLRTPYRRIKYSEDFTMSIQMSTPTIWNISRIVYPKLSATVEGANQQKYQEINYTYRRTKNISKEELFSLDKATAEGCEIPKMKRCLSLNSRSIALESTLVSITGATFKLEINSPDALSGTAANISTIIPDYKTGDFGSIVDKSLPLNNNLGRLLTVPDRPLVRNIVLFDENNKKTRGYYFDYGYFNTYKDMFMLPTFKTSEEDCEDYEHSNFSREVLPSAFRFAENREAKLQLKGVYPMSFSGNTVKLEKGHTFSYHGSALPNNMSPARDAWGYFNGEDANADKTEHAIPLAACVPANKVSNLEPKLEYAQVGTLRAIQSPQGAVTTLTYELHKANNYFDGFIQDPARTPPCTITPCVAYNIRQGIDRPIGGLRVKEIRTTEKAGNYTTITYKYTKRGLTESSGYLAILPDQRVTYEDYEWKCFLSGHRGCGDRRRIFKRREVIVPSVSSLLMSRYFIGNYITYEYVEEESKGYVNYREDTYGRKGYEFYVSNDVIYCNNVGKPYPAEGQSYTYTTANVPDSPMNPGIPFGKLYSRFNASLPYVDNSNVTEFPTPVRYIYQGMLKRVLVFDKAGNVISEETHTYEPITTPADELQCAVKIGPFAPKLGTDETAYQVFSHVANIAFIIATAGGSAPVMFLSTAAYVAGQISQPAGIVGNVVADQFRPKVQVTASAIANNLAISVGFSIALGVFRQLFFDWGFSTFDDESNYRFFRKYKTSATSARLKTTEAVAYERTGGVTTQSKAITEYEYEGTRHHQATRIITKQYDNANALLNTFEKRIRYSYDFSFPILLPVTDENAKGIRALQRRGILTPVEIVSIKDGHVLTASYTQFNGSAPAGDENAINAFGMPKSFSATELANPEPIAQFQFASFTGGRIITDDTYREQRVVAAYNKRGIPIEQYATDNPNVKRKTQFDTQTDFILANQTTRTPSGVDYVTTYEYSTPNFGVSKLTNSDGSSTSVDYDELGRQVAVRDQNNHVLKSYTYNTVPVPQPVQEATFFLEGVYTSGEANPAQPIPLTDQAVITTAQLNSLYSVGPSRPTPSTTTRRLAVGFSSTASTRFSYELNGPPVVLLIPYVIVPGVPIRIPVNIGYADKQGKQFYVPSPEPNPPTDTESSLRQGFAPQGGSYTLTVKGYDNEFSTELKTIKKITFRLENLFPNSINLATELVAQTAPVGQQYSYSIPPELFRPSSSTTSSFNSTPTPPPTVAIIQQSLPSWLSASGNTVTGTPPDSAVGRTILVKAIITSATNETAVVEYPLTIVSACDAANPVWLEGRYVQAPLTLKASAVAESSSVFGATVMPGANLSVQAGQVVRLKPGFVVKPGGTFKAKIAGCP